MMGATSKNTFSSQPVLAFTGMSGIFPGSPDLDAFWQRIVGAEVAPLTSLEERWKVPRSAYFDPQPGKPDRVYLDRAFCLPENGDPKGRQVAYGSEVVGALLKGLGREGTLPDLSEVGLVLGTSWSDQGYFHQDIDYFFGKDQGSLDAVSRRYSPDEQISAIQATHQLGGPGLAVDAACASSIYAVELAADLIRSHQTRAVIVLGLSVGLPLFLMAAFSRLMALSASGESLPFSEAACGMVPGEGVGAVLLEPIEDALRSGRKVLGILRAVGLSSDGAEGSVFAPSAMGQHLAYRRAYKGIASPDVDYIEAHGTATVLGDETETASLDRFFGSQREESRKLAVGSVKALVGHCLAAAGMASLIKTLLMFRENVIPPHIPVSPHPRLADSCIFLPPIPNRLPDKQRLRRIGISSFGFGGSNAHMVVDAYDERHRKRYCASRPNSREATPLAIVDLEVAFGNVVSAMEWEKVLNEKGPALVSFPRARFFPSWGDRDQGLFFPDELEIDIKGFRIGPKPLARIDPLQNLASYLVSLLIRRHPTIQESDDTAVVLCSNMGGGKAHQLARREFLRFYHPDAREEESTETTMEELASGLSSMLSGYPALHFDLRAFHHTLSGDAGLFWTTVLTAPSLLAQHCQNLILGGGNYFKTPLDLCHPNIRSREGSSTLVEGFAVFLLKNLEKAKEDGDRVLAEVRGIVTGKEARDFQEACQSAEIDPTRVELRELCQLKTGFRSKFQGRPEGKGSWYLGEASGIEALSSALLKEGGLASVEVYSGEKLVLALFLEKTDSLQTRPHAMEFPLKLSFRDPCLSQTGKASEPKNRKASKAQSFLDPARGEQTALGESGEADELLMWHTSTAEVLTKYLCLQKKIIQAFPSGMQSRSFEKAEERVRRIEDPACWPGLRQPRRREENQVLRQIRSEEGQRQYSAELIVDEGHPYFFDHPLDHVPGILLIEGLVQLLEVATQDRMGDTGRRGFFVREMHVLFTKWCEKDLPVILRLEKEDGSSERGNSFVCKAEQGSEIVGRVGVKTDFLDRGEAAFDHRRPPVPEPSSKHALLHKQRPENVVVSELERTGDRYFVEALPPPPNHILAEGDPAFHSCVYLLEASRQCSLMITHAVGGISLDLSMILLYARMSLNRPIFRKERLTITYIPETQSPFSPGTIGTMNLMLCADDEVVGRTSTHALIVDVEEYRRQRWKTGESNA